MKAVVIINWSTLSSHRERFNMLQTSPESCGAKWQQNILNAFKNFLFPLGKKKNKKGKSKLNDQCTETHNPHNLHLSALSK